MSDEQAEAATDAPNGEGDATTDDAELEERTDEAAADDPEELRARIESLEERSAELEAERDDLESRLKRKQAEFENYKKRQQKRRDEERARATEDLVERLIEVRDNLSRALGQEEGTEIREGVEATFRQLDDVLVAENVEPIEPEPGTDVDPQRHEVLLRVESEQPEGTVADVHRPGYEMAGKVLREAQVTVSEE